MTESQTTEISRLVGTVPKEQSVADCGIAETSAKASATTCVAACL